MQLWHRLLKNIGGEQNIEGKRWQ